MNLRRKSEGQPDIINTIEFKVLNNGDWMTIKDFEYYVEKLLKSVSFTNEEIEDYLKICA